MTAETKKKDTPPYIAFSTFFSFIKGLSKTGIPSRIDKSLLRNMSGGNQSALLAALKWFDLIDDVGAHGKPLEDLVNAGDNVGEVLREMLPSAYKFMTDGSIQLDRATGSQVEEKFRAYGLTGSTIVKTMAFFISACKEAGIPLSAHIKLPKVVRANGTPKARKGRVPPLDDAADDEEETEDLDTEGFERFEVPIPGKKSVRVIVPSDLDADDWTMLQSMITVYINRWKGFAGGKS